MPGIDAYCLVTNFLVYSPAYEGECNQTLGDIFSDSNAPTWGQICQQCQSGISPAKASCGAQMFL